MNVCRICNSTKIFLYKDNLYDDRFGYPGRFRLLKCPDCGHKMLEGEFSPGLLSRLYSEYYPRSSFNPEDHKPYKEVRGFQSWFAGDSAFAFRWVPENVRVLDIGCGFGEALGYQKMRGCEVYGVDADENVRRVADKFGYDVRVGLFDPNLFDRSFFDYVTLDQVIEHVTDPLGFMQGVYQVLKPGGYVVLSTPNSNGWGAKCFGRFWINWHVPYHLQFFSYKSMKIVSENAGLFIQKYKIRTSSEWLFYQLQHLVTFPNEGEPSGFWSAKGKSIYKVKIVNKLLFLIRKLHIRKINHLITRLFDGMYIGDNYIFILRKPL